jgi:hypothetical protein
MAKKVKLRWSSSAWNDYGLERCRAQRSRRPATSATRNEGSGNSRPQDAQENRGTRPWRTWEPIHRWRVVRAVAWELPPAVQELAAARDSGISLGARPGAAQEPAPGGGAIAHFGGGAGNQRPAVASCSGPVASEGSGRWSREGSRALVAMEEVGSGIFLNRLPATGDLRGCRRRKVHRAAGGPEEGKRDLGLGRRVGRRRAGFGEIFVACLYRAGRL